MMDSLNATLKFITPCFCAGAEQGIAEVRAPAVRGQLRWWFRVLGGTPLQEKRLFGGVHAIAGNDKTAASKVIVRIDNVKLPAQRPSLPSPNRPGYYLFHFARVAGNKNGIFRFEPSGWLPPETSFDISVCFRNPLEAEEELFRRAWQAFLLLGGLGLRQTRGCGAFQSSALLTHAEVLKSLHDLAASGVRAWYVAEANGNPAFVANWQKAMELLEATLGHLRQHGFSAGKYGNNATPLGISQPRQASALHLRPVMTQEGIIPVLFYAPKVLGEASRGRSGELAAMLDRQPEIRVPYQQRSPSPDTRDIVTLRKI